MSLINTLRKISQSKNVVIALYILAILFISLRNLTLPWGDLFADGGNYSHYNNYIIFKQSFFHLLQHKDLYIHYPLEQYDLFKYPPTFALLFAPFSLLPDLLGYTLWTTLNMMLPIFAISRISDIANLGKILFSILLLLEGFTSALNSQSNGLVLGLLLLAFVAMQRGRVTQAVIFIWLTAFIKLFGVLFFAMLWVFPNGFKKSLIRIPTVFALLFLLPWPILGWNGLLNQYHWMFNLLAHDHGYFVKYSVMGWLQQWFGLRPDKNLILFVGLCLQVLPFLFLFFKQKLWLLGSLQRMDHLQLTRWQFLYAGSWLLWMVIFNHMAESATYVIAVGGALFTLAFLAFDVNLDSEGSQNISLSSPENSQWFERIFCAMRRQKLRGPMIISLVFMIVFTMLGPTDIYPKQLRLWIVETAQLKAFPCILLWDILLFEMFKWRKMDT